MLRILGKIVGSIIIKSGLGIERTSTDYYYSLDSIMATLDPLLKKTGSIYTMGEAAIFRYLDDEIFPRYRLEHAAPDAHTAAGHDNHAGDYKKSIIRICSPGNELSILEQWDMALHRTGIIWISSTFYAINKNPEQFFSLLGFLKKHGYTHPQILAGTQESYWQPLQDYAGMSIITCKDA